MSEGENFADVKGADDTPDGGSNSQAHLTSHIEEVSTVSFVAPKYEDDAELWFRQLEAKFAVSRIRAQLSKYYIAFGNLPGVLLKPVVASLGKPSDCDRPYDDLKNAVLSRESLSVTQRIDAVLKDVAMGDRKPSDYFSHLKELAGDNFSEDAVYKIWLLRIPAALKPTLIVLQKEPLKYRLSVADELMELQGTTGQVAAVAAVDRKDRFSEFREELLAEMRGMLANVLHSPVSRGRPRSQNRDRSQSRPPPRPKKVHELCWHHFKFGEKAYKCSSATCKFGLQAKN
jgi:hypothetical protein